MPLLHLSISLWRDARVVPFVPSKCIRAFGWLSDLDGSKPPPIHTHPALRWHLFSVNGVNVRRS